MKKSPPNWLRGKNQEWLKPLYEQFLTILINISPHCTLRSVPAASRLMQLLGHGGSGLGFPPWGGMFFLSPCETKIINAEASFFFAHSFFSPQSPKRTTVFVICVFHVRCSHFSCDKPRKQEFFFWSTERAKEISVKNCLLCRPGPPDPAADVALQPQPQHASNIFSNPLVLEQEPELARLLVPTMEVIRNLLLFDYNGNLPVLYAMLREVCSALLF